MCLTLVWVKELTTILLTFEVWTDGSLKPEEAVALGSKIIKEQLQIFLTFDETIEPEEEEEEKVAPQLNEIFSVQLTISSFLFVRQTAEERQHSLHW